MADKGGALKKPRAPQAAPTAPSTKTQPPSTMKAPLNRLVVACVGCSTLATAVGDAWRGGHGGGQGAATSLHTLILGLEMDLAAGAAALAVGLWLAGRLQRRADAATAAVAAALADLAADADPQRLKPLEATNDLTGLAQVYNNVLVGLTRRERQVAFHTMAQGEQRRLAELAMLRQDMAAPLATAKSWAQDLGHKGWPQESSAPEVGRRDRRIAEALGRVGESMLATLDDITHRTHASPNGFQVQAALVDVCELTEDVCTLLWAQAAAKGLDLAVYIDPKTPRQVQGDPVRLRQIVGGLVSSALAVTHDGGVLIEVEPDSPTSVRISIHDTGPALARPADDGASGGADAQPGARPGDPDGTLPARLAMYRQMVKAMGGAFAAPAQRDRGATVAFRLQAAINDAPTLWAGAALQTASEGSTSAPRVLLAVRGPCTRRALSRYLARAGLVASVYDGGDPPADARLLIGDAKGLPASAQHDIQVVRLAAPEDLTALKSLSGPTPSATLTQPLNRAELETLLRKVKGRQPLQPERRTGPPASAASASRSTAALTEDEQALLADLDRAAERDELSLAYQPQVERDGERILGVEALLRWTHPTRGPVSPGVFIPLAEKAGRIAPVTAWVIDRVLAETQYLSGLQVAFNASALEFADQGFVDRLLAAVAETGYDARRLEVEITETAILEHETPVRESMDRLHAAGIGVALDDFGAGYSSLSHLRRYPFDKLKIDREFITDCSRDMESATVVHAVVSIGRALGMKVIAEGVETQTQCSFLRIAGVYAMQGYLFGKPVPIDNLAPLIGATRTQALG
jgi:EAL domain-containing protein (putative c-di-GMP-specific phosphodiesterase class I)/signal transduction histidine kinase